MYFGYVFRIISGDLNIDLIYNFYNSDSTYFTLVQGQELLMRLDSDFRSLCSDWTDFRFKFDTKNGLIQVIMSDTSLNVNGLGFGKGDEIGIFFGLCDFGTYKTTDVPAMNIRDIRFSENGRVTHFWPLDERTGDVVNDREGKCPGNRYNSQIHSFIERIIPSYLAKLNQE